MVAADADHTQEEVLDLVSIHHHIGLVVAGSLHSPAVASAGHIGSASIRFVVVDHTATGCCSAVLGNLLVRRCRRYCLRDRRIARSLILVGGSSS